MISVNYGSIIALGMKKFSHPAPKRALPTRRSAMIMTGIAGLMAVKPALAALVATPAQMSGPFYPLSKPDDSDGDLTMVAGRPKRASGIVVDVVGRILDTRGYPLAGAFVEIWQADAFGAYHHPKDPNSVKADQNFQGYAVVRAAKDGGYRFRTIKPKSYRAGSILRTPHIHLQIAEGTTSRLITQMYFPNEELNQKDVLFGRIATDAGRAAVTAQETNTGALVQYRFDIIL